MDLSNTPRMYTPSTELQRRAVEARRNQTRLARYRLVRSSERLVRHCHNIQLYLYAQRFLEALNRGR